MQGLAKMCETLICHIHWNGEDPGKPVEGHNAYPASGCRHETCRGYAEGHRLFTFGRHEDLIYELRDERDKLQNEVERLRALVTPEEAEEAEEEAGFDQALKEFG